MCTMSGMRAGRGIEMWAKRAKIVKRRCVCGAPMREDEFGIVNCTSPICGYDTMML
jgi:hypothetical protein